MNYGQIIYDLVNAATTLPVGALQMAQTQPAPYVVYAVNFIQPISHKGKVEPLDLVNFTLITYHTDFVLAQAEANKLRTALSWPTATGVQNCWLESSEHMFADNAQYYAIVQSYSMRVAYTPYVAVVSGGIGEMIIGSTFIIA